MVLIFSLPHVHQSWFDAWRAKDNRRGPCSIRHGEQRLDTNVSRRLEIAPITTLRRFRSNRASSPSQPTSINKSSTSVAKATQWLLSPKNMSSRWRDGGCCPGGLWDRGCVARGA